jgi:hypothetical protein
MEYVYLPLPVNNVAMHFSSKLEVATIARFISFCHATICQQLGAQIRES